MQKIFAFIYDYVGQEDKLVLLVSSLFMAALVYLNYRHGLERRLTDETAFPQANFFGHYLIYLATFAFPYVLYWLIGGRDYFKNSPLVFLILFAPALMAARVLMKTNLPISSDENWNGYWNHIITNPLQVVILALILAIFWIAFFREQSFFGVTGENFDAKPYLLMLLIMAIPIALAGTQSDFLRTYPRMKLFLPEGMATAWQYKIVYEISYATAFGFVELFFRGFLIFAFVRWVGRDAILPMACFYCAIHFNKPLFECISSFFGGALLGIVALNTGSIYGGLIVHIGIAWMMELAAVLSPKIAKINA